MPDFAVSTAFNATGNLNRAIGVMGNKLRGFGNTAERSFGRASRGARTFGSIVGGILTAGLIRRGFNAMTEGVKSFVTEAQKIEDAVAGFTPLLGGVEKANELVDKLNQTAATTPFQFDNIASAAKQLLPVMNGDIENTIETFRRLGDTAGGNAQKLESITRGFTKSMLKGKVDMESLNMIAEAGVPIYTELSDSMGISVQEMMNMSRAGTITSKDLDNAFKVMTSEGGIFFKGMEIASQTLSGRLSTMRDNINLTKAAIGTALLPTIKPLIDRFIEVAGKMREWATANQELINQKIQDTIAAFTAGIKIAIGLFKRFKPLIIGITAGIVAWKVATILLIAAQKAQAAFIVIGKFMQFVRIIGMISKSKGIWAAAQWALNVAMAANPIGLIIIGIAALVTGIILLVKNWDKVKEVMAVVWQAVKDFAMNAWNILSGLLDNPFIAAIGTIFLPFITIPALILKHWEPIKAFFLDLWNNVIKPVVDGVSKVFGGPEGRDARQERREERRTARTAPNQGEAQQRSITFVGQLDIAGAPPGSTSSSRTTGAPPINMALLGVNP